MLMHAALLVPMRVALDVDAARHDEDAVLDAHHLDLGAVEPRQHRAGDDLVDRPSTAAPPPRYSTRSIALTSGLSSCALKTIAIFNSSRNRRAIATTPV